MRLLPRSLVLSFLLLAAVARATVGLGLQTQLGNPSGATTNPAVPNNYLLERPQYSLSYNNSLLEANWVSWNFTTADRGATGRTDAFAADPLLPSGFNIVNQTSYSGSGFDRGHMCPSADRTLTVADNEATFFMTNMVPQAPDNNQGPWAVFENETRAIAATGFEMLIISGPGGFGGSTIASGVAIPGFTWKIALAVPVGPGSAVSRITASTRVIAIKMPNIAGIRSNPWTDYVTSIAQIEADTGLTFLTDVPAAIAAALRTVVDGQSSAGSPVVTTQPAAQSAPVGGSATFSVVATGDGVLSYQWFKDGNEITGATAATYAISPVQAADAGAYSVLVSNLVGATSSTAAALTVTGLPPVVTTSPASPTAAAGSTVTFTVAATGSPTLTYQWRKGGGNLANGGKVAGATTATLTLANVQAGDMDAYDVVVTNSVSSATSAPASLTVTPAAPTIVTQPVSVSIAPNGTAVFTVSARGTEPFSYQWRKAGANLANGANVAGADTASLTVSAVTAADVASYDVVVTNAAGFATSNSAGLTLDTVTTGRISYLGGTYSQNFNALPISGNTTISGTQPLDLSPVSATLNGWQIATSSATAPVLIAGTGSSNTGGVYSFGSAALPSDRALGTLASGSTTRRVGAVLVNNTGLTITQFTLSYNGEQWRNGGNTAAHTLTFGYALGAAGINDAVTFNPVADLNFVSPINTATAAALDGNAAANRSARTAVVTGISWTPGQTLVLRWNDPDDSGSDHGFGVDDVIFSTPVATLPTRPSVVSTTPAAGATNVLLGSAVTIVFDQPVSVGANWFSLSSTNAGALSATVTASADFKTYTLTPPAPFASNDTVSVTVFAAGVTERGSGTLQPAADTSFSFTTETIAAPVAPTVTTQPIAQTVVAGSPVSFTVAASGTAPFTYAWRKGGTPIVGNASAATATLTIASAALADIGNYDCVVTNVAGSDVSQAAALNVTLVPPTITTQPLAQSVLPGSNVSFTVAASGTAPFTYVWRKGSTVLSDGGNISGSSTATLSLTGVALADSGDYSVIVSNGAGSAPSNAATLDVTTALPSNIYWNFGTTAGSAAPTSGVPSGVTGGTVTQGNNNGTTTLATSVSVSSGYPGASGAFNAGAAARIGALSTTVGTGGSTFFTFAFTPPAGRQFTVSRITFGSRSTGTGPQAYSIFSSVDNFATAIATGTFLNNSVWALHDRTVSVAGATDATVTFRIYGHNGTGSPGSNTANWRIDDLTVTATVVEPAAVAPQITTQPLPQIATVGDTVVFTVAATGTPAPTFQWRRNLTNVGTGPTLTLPSVTTAAAGIYDVVVSNSAGSVTSSGVALTVNPAPATVVLADLGQAYTGAPRPVAVATSPAGLAVSVTYDGSPTPPTYPGTYAVVATIADPDRTGSASGNLTVSTTALVRRAPTINSGLDGSIQVVNAENISLPGTAWIAGDLLVQGTPTVNVNAAAIYGSTLDAAGSPTPNSFSVTLNAGTTLAHVVRRINPVTLPVVAAPPVPTGTRNVVLSAAGQSAGDFATLRNLTLSSSAGLVAVPPGTYGVFAASGNTGFVLGVAGSTTPAVYNLQGLTINALPGNAQIQVVGPVIINLPSSAIVSGNAGSAANPGWLVFRHATNGFTSNGNVTVHASVLAPNGLVSLGGAARLRGTVVSDRLTLGNTSVLEDPRP